MGEYIFSAMQIFYHTLPGFFPAPPPPPGCAEIDTEFLYIHGSPKLIPAKFSTLLRTWGAQKLICAEFSTNKV